MTRPRSRGPAPRWRGRRNSRCRKGWSGPGQDIAGAELLDRDVDHPVVARRAEMVTAGSHDAGAGVDRAQAGGERRRPWASWTVATPCFGQAVDDGGGGALDLLDDDDVGHVRRAPSPRAPAGAVGVEGLDRLQAPGLAPFIRSFWVQTTGCQSGARIRRAPALASSTRLPAGSQT